MICILLLHRHGGATTCTGMTTADARAACARKCTAFKESYVLATLPYEAKPGKSAAWDTTPPNDVKATWGAELLALYNGET